MNNAYRIAFACGATPLATGILIFLLWLVTRWKWLVAAGIYTIPIGTVVVALGLIFLAISCVQAVRDPSLVRVRVWRAILACAALLLSNFAVAYGIVAAVIAIM